MKIALAQLNFHIGNFGYNCDKIIDSIIKAKKEKADLIVFPELAVCGYPPRDFLEFNDFINQCELSIDKIRVYCDDIAAIIGCPTKNPEIAGKNLYNSALFIADKKVQQTIHKSLLPNYDIFDEYRYFEPNRTFEIITYKNQNIALTICEDLWNVDNDPMYVIEPMAELIQFNPDIIINIAASPFHENQAEARLSILKTNALKYNLPVVYVNHIGAQTELIFDGGSLVLNSLGNKVLKSPLFVENQSYVEIDNPAKAFASEEPSKIEMVHDALVLGVRDYFSKMGFSNAVLGLSGGIDSAVVMVIAAKALGSNNVTGILMPSQFSTDHSVTDAITLAKNLGSPYEIIPVKNIYESFSTELKPFFKDLPFNIAEENLQARIRAVLLMAWSNKFGNILLNTSNKSEAAVGYGTLYGDMCGGLSVIGDVYKTRVYELAKFINRENEIIPENIITKAPSAELRPDQKDSDSLPEYAILDEILNLYIETHLGPDEIIKKGFDLELVRRILKLVNTNEYKRYQTPPILRITSKAFGMGRRMPIVGKYLS
jgi:NAD+ synthase (glutamine-hydrolysing)